MGATTAIRIRSGTLALRRSSVPPRAWVGPTPNRSQQIYYEWNMTIDKTAKAPQHISDIFGA